MSPYYQDDLVTLYHGDCRDVLPNLRAQSVDVVLTDPPFFMPASHYGIRGSHGGRPLAPRSWGDTSVLASFWGQILNSVIPTMRRTGHVLVFCNGESYPVFFPETYRRFDVTRSIVWDKGRIGMGSPWRNQHELLLAARWSGSFRGEDRGCADVVRHAPVQHGDRVHPVDKPVALLAELLRPISPANAVVLDPFAGGGSTLIAARESGHRAIGIESEERYCEQIARRFDQQTLPFGEAS